MVKHHLLVQNLSVINTKWIVLHNTTSASIKFVGGNGKEFTIQGGGKFFKKYDQNDTLTIELTNPEESITTRCIGFIIHICIQTPTTQDKIWNNEFYLGCGGLNKIFREKLSEEVITILSPQGDQLIDYTVTNTTVIDMMELHYMYNNPTVKNDIDITQRIPRKIHFIWLKKDNSSTFCKGYFDSWYHHHMLDWTFYIWTDFDIDMGGEYKNTIVKTQNDIKDLFTKYSKKFSDAIQTYHSIPLMGGKSDILRYLILYDGGGLYVDINDFECFKPMTSLFNKYSFICGAETSHSDLKDIIMINNAFIAYVKKHKIIKRMLSKINTKNLHNIHKYIDNWVKVDDELSPITGVGLFRSMVLGFLFDKHVSHKEKEEVSVLPSSLIYPSCFYDDQNLHLIDFIDQQEKWRKIDSYGTHYSQHSYLNLKSNK